MVYGLFLGAPLWVVVGFLREGLLLKVYGSGLCYGFRIKLGRARQQGADMCWLFSCMKQIKGLEA